MRKPSIQNIEKIMSGEIQETINGKWYPARPITWNNRFTIAFLVLIGKADAVIWPEQALREKNNGT